MIPSGGAGVGVTGRRVRSTMANNSCKAEEQLSYEGRRLSRPEPAADDRGGRDQPPGAARGAVAHGLRRALPQRSAFYGGAVPDPDTGRARPRILGGRGGGR